MAFHKLTQNGQVDALREASKARPQLIFKHSTRCSISSMVWARVEERLPELDAVIDIHFLDLIAHRTVSNYVADVLNERHESPQALLLSGGEVILEQSHMGVQPDELLEEAQQAAV